MIAERKAPAREAIPQSEPVRHRFTPDELWRMERAGVLPPDLRVELIGGDILEMAAQGPRHTLAVNALNLEFVRRFGLDGRAIVSVQNSIRLPADGSPQPDFALIRPPQEQYRERLPEARDILLIVEVSDTTLAQDRGTKLGLYAADGVLEYWILNLEQDVLEVYREPDGARYRRSFTLERGERLAPLAFPEDLVVWFQGGAAGDTDPEAQPD